MSGKTKPGPATKAARQAQKRAHTTGARTLPPGRQDQLTHQPLVGGRWLLYAILGVVALAAVCAYLTLCLLFYQGQWQIVFRPSQNITSTPAVVGMKYDEVRFDFTGTGQPQLAG